MTLQNRNNILNTVKDYAMVIFGTAAYTVGVSIFIIPSEIGIGGLTGISSVIYKLTGFPVGITLLLLNIPLIISGFLMLGHKFIIKSLFSVGLFTLFSDVLLAQLSFNLNDKLLNSILGGALLGIGLGVLYSIDASSGGSDILNRLLQQKYPHMQMGRLTMITDGIIIGVSTIIFGDITSALYAAVVIFIQARLINYVLYGLETGKMVVIVTNHSEKVTKQITKQMRRGSTILEGKGGYSGDSHDIILCAVRRNEYYRLKTIIKSSDEKAFVIITDASEVVGEGFKSKTGLS